MIRIDTNGQSLLCLILEDTVTNCGWSIREVSIPFVASQRNVKDLKPKALKIGCHDDEKARTKTQTTPGCKRKRHFK